LYFGFGNNSDTVKRNWARRILGGLSFTSALFVFQACYGMPQDMMNDSLVEGKVTSRTTGEPIRDILVSAKEVRLFVYSDSLGEFTFYTPQREQLTLQIKDVDASENGSFQSRDTVLEVMSPMVYLDIALEEK
jgi:hypothetical protein